MIEEQLDPILPLWQAFQANQDKDLQISSALSSLYEEENAKAPRTTLNSTHLQWPAKLMGDAHAREQELLSQRDELNRERYRIEDAIMSLLGEGYYKLPDGRILIRESHQDDNVLGIREPINLRQAR